MNLTFPCDEGNHLACNDCTGWCQCYCHKPLKRIRERLARVGTRDEFLRIQGHELDSFIGAILPSIEAEIQKHTAEKARLVDEFRRLAAKARANADALPRDHFSRPMKGEWVGTSNTYLHAAKMLEESKP